MATTYMMLPGVQPGQYYVEMQRKWFEPERTQSGREQYAKQLLKAFIKKTPADNKEDLTKQLESFQLQRPFKKNNLMVIADSVFMSGQEGNSLIGIIKQYQAE